MASEPQNDATSLPTEWLRLWDLARRKGMLTSKAYAEGLRRLRESVVQGLDTVTAIVDAGLPRDQVEELQAVHADSGPIGLPLDLPTEAEAIRVGKYRLVEALGVGGMGAVYRAVDEDLGRTVALKVLKGGSEFASDDSADRFQQEAMSLAKLDHPNIVRVYETGRAEGQAYLALELVDGGSLSARDYGQLTIAQKTAIGRDIARALQHAHEHGLVHRDVKPSNVLLRRDGTAVLGDFGLVRDVSSKLRLTMSFAWLGTPAYMSPEQAEGRTASIDFRTDLYSLGVLLYELFTGDLPFQADDFESLRRRILEEEAPPLRSRARGVPADVEAVVMKAMEKRPDERYASASVLAEDLDRVLRSEAPSVRPTSALGRWWRRLRRRSGVAMLAGMLLLALTAAGSVALGPESPLAEARYAQVVSAIEAAVRARAERLEETSRALATQRVRALLEECSSHPGRPIEREMREHLTTQFDMQEVRTDLAIVEDVRGRTVWRSSTADGVELRGQEAGSSLVPAEGGPWLLHRHEVFAPVRDDVRVGWLTLGLRVEEGWYAEALAANRSALVWARKGSEPVVGGGVDAAELARLLAVEGTRGRARTASRDYRLFEQVEGEWTRVVAIEDPAWRHRARAVSLGCAALGALLAVLGAVARLRR